MESKWSDVLRKPLVPAILAVMVSVVIAGWMVRDHTAHLENRIIHAESQGKGHGFFDRAGATDSQSHLERP